MIAALYPDVSTDTLYGVSGAAIVPISGGPLEEATWRSGMIRSPGGVPTGFAWARVQGVFVTGVRLRLYADRSLIYTSPVIMSPTPIRLPAVMARLWEIELVGKDRITELVVADNTEALL